MPVVRLPRPNASRREEEEAPESETEAPSEPSSGSSDNRSDPKTEKVASTSPKFNLVGTESAALSEVSREHLQCPVCLDVCRTKPIYQCQNGHTICNGCIHQLHTCPLCRVYLSRDKIRNRALETMLDHVEVTCPYRDKGCNEMVKTIRMQEHILSCAYGKVIICPSLGFADCEEALACEKVMDHLKEVHKLNVLPGRYRKNILTYAEFLSTKTLASGNFIKWDSIVLTPFADTGPFIIMCDVDVQRKCTATFAIVYAPPKHVLSDPSDEENAEVPNTKFFIEFSIRKETNHEGVPLTITWKGESMLYSEYKDGCQKGVFKIQLAEFRKDAINGNAGNDLSALGAAALPLPPAAPPLRSNESQQNIAAGNDGDAANATTAGATTAGATTAGALIRRKPRARAVRQNLTVEIRFAKTAKDLENPVPVPTHPTQASTSFYGTKIVTNFTAESHVVFKSTKCSECKETPIRGTRFKCLECKSYDLCFKCNEKEVHKHHIFLQIKDPLQNKRAMKNFTRIHWQGPDENGEEVQDENDKDAAPARKRQKKVTPRTVLASATANSSTEPGTATTTLSSNVMQSSVIQENRPIPAPSAVGAVASVATAMNTAVYRAGFGSGVGGALTHNRIPVTDTSFNQFLPPVTGASTNRPPVFTGTSSNRPPVTGASTIRPPVFTGTSSNRPPVTGASSNRPPVFTGTSSNRPAVVTGTSSNLPPVVTGTSSNRPAVTAAPIRPSPLTDALSSRTPANNAPINPAPVSTTTGPIAPATRGPWNNFIPTWMRTERL